MPRKRVYVESSVISYLTARPSKDPVKLARQQLTWGWWDQREKWELFAGRLVMTEIQRGNPNAAAKRMEIARTLSPLREPPEAKLLSTHLLVTGVMPENSEEDAFHIAVATICRMDYLVTWNQAHIFNPHTIEKLYSAIRDAGHVPCALVRPDGLLEAESGS
jgi:hypothetical protein